MPAPRPAPAPAPPRRLLKILERSNPPVDATWVPVGVVVVGAVTWVVGGVVVGILTFGIFTPGIFTVVPALGVAAREASYTCG